MSGIASVFAVVLAAVFASAALLKLRDPAGTTTDFTELGLPRARFLAGGVPIIELVIAALLLAWPGWGATAGFALLAAFTTLLAGVVRSGRVVSCACFGGAASKPIDARHLGRNALLAAWTLPVLAIDRLSMPSATEALVASALVVVPAGLLHRWRNTIG